MNKIKFSSYKTGKKPAKYRVKGTSNYTITLASGFYRRSKYWAYDGSSIKIKAF